MAYPSAIPRPAIRLKDTLAVGAAFDNTDELREIVPVGGSARVRVRIKATNTGNLLVSPVGPDFQRGQSGYTVYTTGASASTAVAADTEVKVDVDLYGENYVEVLFTGTATGVITFLDVSQL